MEHPGLDFTRVSNLPEPPWESRVYRDKKSKRYFALAPSVSVVVFGCLPGSLQRRCDFGFWISSPRFFPTFFWGEMIRLSNVLLQHGTCAIIIAVLELRSLDSSLVFSSMFVLFRST